MAKNTNGFTFTKADLAKVKNKESKMTPAQKRAASKALVDANTAANNPRKKGKA